MLFRAVKSSCTENNKANNNTPEATRATVSGVLAGWDPSWRQSRRSVPFSTPFLQWAPCRTKGPSASCTTSPSAMQDSSLQILHHTLSSGTSSHRPRHADWTGRTRRWPRPVQGTSFTRQRVVWSNGSCTVYFVLPGGCAGEAETLQLPEFPIRQAESDLVFSMSCACRRRRINTRALSTVEKGCSQNRVAGLLLPFSAFMGWTGLPRDAVPQFPFCCRTPAHNLDERVLLRVHVEPTSHSDFGSAPEPGACLQMRTARMESARILCLSSRRLPNWNKPCE
jgi:hypothetical protein